MDLIYRLWGRRIQRQLAANSMRPRGFDGMQYAFSGTDGKAYYTWLDLSDMPPVRQKQIERCLQMANAGIGEKTLNELCDIAEVAIMDIVKAQKPEERSRKAAKAAQVIGEIKRRPTEIVPEDVYYDIAACFAIREDEDPRGQLDTVTHGQKIAMFKESAQRGHEYFTKLPAFRKLLGSLLTSESAFMELLSGWAATRMRMQAVRSVHAN